MGRSNLSVTDRFWAKVDVRQPDECWVWTAGRQPNGYGQFRLNGRSLGAHRLLWRMEHGPIPAGLYVCHHCDNPPCVNPNHLYLGTPSRNTADAYARGRITPATGERHGSRTHPEALVRGSAVRGAKLTEAQAREILASSEGQRVLAKRFGVDHATVSSIKCRVNWKHL